MNQAIFEEILIEVDGKVIYARMAQPFAAFHDEEFRRWLAESATNPGPQEARGSNIATLVDLGRHNSNRDPVIVGPIIDLA